MKNTTKLVWAVMLGILVGCSKSDDSPPKEAILQNGAPLSFNLIAIADGTTEVDVMPALSWESAENPNGVSVSYDLYLDTTPDPTTLYGSNITTNSFQVVDRLKLLTAYYWKVVAKDTDGKASQSPIRKFTTRYYKFPDTPVTVEADFSIRTSHTSLVFKDKMWVIAVYYKATFITKTNIFHQT